MEERRHPYQSMNYEYMRPAKKYIRQKTEQEIYAHDSKGNRVFRQIYYGIQIPDEESAKVMQMNQLVYHDVQSKGIKLPEYYSFHDQYRFADAASFKFTSAVRDVNDICPWIEDIPNFVLTPEAAKLLDQGNLYLGGRDKFGNQNIILNMNSKMQLNEEGAMTMMNAMTF